MRRITILVLYFLVIPYIVNAEPSFTFSSDSESDGANTGARNWTFINFTSNVSLRNHNVIYFEINRTDGVRVNVSIGGNWTRVLFFFENNTVGGNDNFFLDYSPYQKNGSCRGTVPSTCPVGNRSNNWDANGGSVSGGFDGSNDGISVTDSDALDIGGVQVVCVKVRHYVGFTSGSRAFVNHYLSGGGSTDDWRIDINQQSPGVMVYQTQMFGASANPTADGTTVNSGGTGNWEYICSVWDSNSIIIYQNGTRIASTAGASARRASSATTEALQIGYSANYGNYDDGLIDSISIWEGDLPTLINFMNITYNHIVKMGYEPKVNSYITNLTNLPNGTYSYRICGNTTVEGDGSNKVCTTARKVNIGAVDVVPDTTPPTITRYSEQGASCSNWNINPSIPCSTSDVTPTLYFNTSEPAFCAIGITNSNYTTMDSSRNCTVGEGTIEHSCDLTPQDELVYENSTVYLSCKDTSENMNTTSTSGPLSLTITGLEAARRNSIGIAIQNALLSGYTNYTDQQIYARNLSNWQVKGTFDKAAKKGSKMWAFNGIGVSDSYVNLFNLTPVLYTLEFANTTSARITNLTELMINATK